MKASQRKLVERVAARLGKSPTKKPPKKATNRRQRRPM